VVVSPVDDGGDGDHDQKKKPTPRKAARDRALQVARSMDQARQRDMALQKSWARSLPNFCPED